MAGIALTRDDCIRRDVIKALICNFRLEFAAVETQWDLIFNDYFAEDMKLLTPLAKDGLVDVDEKEHRSRQRASVDSVTSVCASMPICGRKRACSSSLALFERIPVS